MVRDMMCDEHGVQATVIFTRDDDIEEALTGAREVSPPI